MGVLNASLLEIRSQEDVVKVRQAVRGFAVDAGFGLVDQTKVVTAASELARNTLIYGRGGTVTLERISDSGRQGVRLVFEDQGPGIANIAEALKDGFSTGSGLGLGLGGARRLSSEFKIESAPQKGTRVEMIRWKS